MVEAGRLTAFYSLNCRIVGVAPGIPLHSHRTLIQWAVMGAGAAQLLTFPLLTRTLFPIATYHSLKPFQRAPKLNMFRTDASRPCFLSILAASGTRCQATTKKNSEHKAVTMAIPVDAQILMPTT